MKKNPEDILYALRHFGEPTRTGFLEEAEELISQDLLTRAEIERVCEEYDTKRKAENLKRYGTEEPTVNDIVKKAMETLNQDMMGLAKLKDNLPKNFVEMSDAKYTSGEELYTSGLGGCLALLVYLEADDKKEGILAHFPPLNLVESIDKIRKIEEENCKGDYKTKKAVLLVGKDDHSAELIRKCLPMFFRNISIETILYNEESIGKVKLNPSEKYWESEQHGRNSF